MFKRIPKVGSSVRAAMLHSGVVYIFTLHVYNLYYSKIFVLFSLQFVFLNQVKYSSARQKWSSESFCRRFCFLFLFITWVGFSFIKTTYMSFHIIISLIKCLETHIRLSENCLMFINVWQMANNLCDYEPTGWLWGIHEIVIIMQNNVIDVCLRCLKAATYIDIYWLIIYWLRNIKRRLFKRARDY